MDEVCPYPIHQPDKSEFEIPPRRTQVRPDFAIGERRECRWSSFDHRSHHNLQRLLPAILGMRERFSGLTVDFFVTEW